jgi:hypothetical protein
MAFPTTDLMSQINILQPGDFVDILASLEQPVLPGPASATEEEPEKELFTFSALQQVEVSAIVVEIVPARATGGTTSSASRASATDEEAQPEPTPTPEPAEINPQAILKGASSTSYCAPRPRRRASSSIRSWLSIYEIALSW